MSTVLPNLTKVALILLLVIGCTAPIPAKSSTRIPPTPTPALTTATSLAATETSVSLLSGTVLAGKEVTTIKVGLFPQRLAIGEGAVWVPNAGAGTLSRIDPQANEVVATILIGKADPNNDVFVPSRVTIGDGFLWAAKNYED